MARFLMTQCPCCTGVFSCSPTRVPSFRFRADGRGYDPNAPRQPICEKCMGYINARRVAIGSAPHPIDQFAYAPDPDTAKEEYERYGPEV